MIPTRIRSIIFIKYKCSAKMCALTASFSKTDFLVKPKHSHIRLLSFNEFYFPGSYRLWSRGGYDPGPAGCAMPRTGHRVPKGRHPPRDQPAGPRLVAGPPGWGRRPDLGRPDTLQELPVQEGGHEAHHCSRRPLWRKRKWRPLK